MRENLRLGIIGLSEGNGHPYSWSAIFNGYDPFAMKLSGFPAIANYLEQETWPDARLIGAVVTCVWTQNHELSRRIAKATHIPTVCNSLEEMAQSVDAVLLARDDSEKHLLFARPFLEKNIPIYIDKPIALSKKKLAEVYSWEQFPGQIFTCSATRYSKDLEIETRVHPGAKGEVRAIHAVAPKTWDRYSIHIIEPVVAFVGIEARPLEIRRWPQKAYGPGKRQSLSIMWDSGLKTFLTTTGLPDSEISLRVLSVNAEVNLTFTDTFSSFRSALADFIKGVRDGTSRSPRKFNAAVVNIIEAGLNQDRQSFL